MGLGIYWTCRWRERLQIKYSFFSITLKIRVWLETQKPAWTGLRRTNGENRVIMKKWNLIGKNQYFRHFLMKTWNEEDPYGIIFHTAVCPEEPWGIDFFEKSSENRNPKNPRNIKNPLFRVQNQDFWTIILVRKAAWTRLDTSRDPEPP